jgi:phage-related protein
VLSVAILGVAAGLTAMKVTQFVETIPKLLTGLQLWAAGQWEVAVPTLITMGLFILIGIAVVGAIALIILAVKNWGAIAHWLQGIWADIAGFFGWLWGVIAGFFVGVGKWFADRFTEAYHGILGAIGGIGAWFQGIWKDIQGAFGAVGNWFHNLWQGVCDDFTSVLGGLGKLAGTIWNGVTGAIKSGFNWVIDLINGVIKNIDNIKVAGFGVSIPLIPHLASGISNFMGGIALVGEQGPELVGLPKGSSVFNASNTSNFLKDIGNFKSSAISGAIASPSAVN